MNKWAREGLRFVDALRTFGKPWSLASRYRHLYFDRRFSPNEIRFFRLLDPSLDRFALDSYSSKEELTKLQCILNSPELHSWTEDKLRFHELSTKHGLPVPTLVSALSPRKYAELGVPIVDVVDGFLNILDSIDQRSLILKPVRGGHGEGVTRLVRECGAWIASGGGRLTKEKLESMIAHTGYREWMLQEEVIGHDRLAELSNTNSLQTCRIVTLLGEQGNVDVLAARLRLVCADNANDNFDYGTTGNAIAVLDPETGRIGSAFGGSGRDPQLTSVAIHPRTGRELAGFQVPEWSVARELAIRAAKVFAPLRTIGWDVAISREGPVIIEGNVKWDTLSGDPRMGEIYRCLEAECSALARLS